MTYPKAVLSFITGPIRVEYANDPLGMGQRTILPHLQKFSHFGFMLTWPLCFHFWLFWRLQRFAGFGNWLPGTEQGIYFRFQPLALLPLLLVHLPLWWRLILMVLIQAFIPAYRWDAELGMKKTRGYFGFHWD